MNAHARFRSSRSLWVAATALLALAACDDTDDPFGLDDDLEPQGLEVRYEWVLEGWAEGSREPVGRPGVHLSWGLPAEWDGEVFRVYSRRSGRSDYVLAATTTSCSQGLCVYTDLDVEPGDSYDYYVATVDERDGREVPSEDALRIDVPTTPGLTTPAAPGTAALDGAVYLRWESTDVETYQVFVESVDGTAELFLIGETDGTAFLDERAENGRTYQYSVAGVDALGHVSDRSLVANAIPRPDYHAEIGYAHSDDAASSGFRFVDSDEDDPIVSGNDPAAQWRLERVGDTFSLVPRGATQVSAGVFTTALTCGPGQESEGEDCLDVTTAEGVPLGAAPVALEAGDTYVLRVTAANGSTHFGKVRVIGVATDSSGVPTLLFDWAYQLQADARALSRQPLTGD